MIMTRQRTMEETAQRREAQRNERHLRRTGRSPVREAVANLAAEVPRFTRHPGSKRGAAHRKAATADIARSKAHTWSVVTGRPLPPAARIRTNSISNAVPMPREVRLQHYGAVVKFSGSVLDLSPRQRSRARRKTGRQLAGVKPGTVAYTTLADAYLALRPDVT
jgi:hypothetical protein